jgi:replicative DNA helicase
MKDHMVELDKRIKQNAKGEMQGVATGLSMLNNYTNGWKPGELIVLAARPSMGKTAVALNLFTKSAATLRKNILFFSLEMDDMSLADRLVCSYGGIAPDSLKRGQLSDQELNKYHESSAQLQQLPIYIDDTARADLIHIGAISKSKRRKGQCDLIVIDYLQLIESPKDNKSSFKNREREVSEMSRGLKLLAKELKVPVILLAQLSRAVESRPGTMKRPILSDLRESGAIEQDADMVIFPYRPEYYGIMEDDNGNSLQGVMILGIAKNRNGRVGDIFCRNSPDLTRFYDFDTPTPF